MAFLDNRYLIGNATGLEIFDKIKDLPVIDPHNHANLPEIAANECYRDAWQLFAATDHYVWEMLRKCSVPEELITGSASPEEKFLALGKVFPLIAGNPVYEWIHHDLKRYFGIEELLSEATAGRIYKAVNEKLATDAYRPQALLTGVLNVEAMSSTDDPLEVRVATVGRAMPEIECRIVDPETNKELPVGEIGEFVARGYNIMKGYYKMPKATAEAIDKDGWLHTGDLACKTPEGNYRITGRLKDMIIRGGENIYPKEIEEFIYTHEKVKDVQVIGVPDEQYGEEICACIVLKEGESMTEDEMKKYILDHMAKHKVPRYIDFVSGFPMNAAGKIQKFKMREEAVERHNLQKAASIETA